MKSIKIVFEEDGTSSVEAIGYNGMGCKEATAPFEKAIGASGSRRLKPEATQNDPQGTAAKRKVGI